MNEIRFLVEVASEGGFNAHAIGHDIFTQADDLLGLHAHIHEAVYCHFGEDKATQLIWGNLK
ncbi:MAG: 2-oxoisovalerate dehydrogenase [Rhodocyclaceae bacterium]|nr:2-oxoisovalerate dehydrogenase [Rhodocyclaceae bacterium]